MDRHTGDRQDEHESGVAGEATDRPGRGARRRWVRARIETDEETYEARLRVEHSQRGLGELLDDGRAYLGLWDAVPNGTLIPQDFLAIHKGAIRSVTLLRGEPGPDRESRS
jgi:hypothetical protein